MRTKNPIGLAQMRSHSDCNSLLPHAQMHRPSDQPLTPAFGQATLCQTDTQHHAQLRMQKRHILAGNIHRLMATCRICQ